MKNLFILLLSVVFLFSCSMPEGRYEKTSNLELRQLVNLSETESTSVGSSSLFFATYYSHEEDMDYVKVFAKVDGTYRFLKFPLEKIRIKLDSTVMNPYIVVHYHYSDNEDKKYSDGFVCSNDNYETYIDNYTVVCHEKYLPEKLLPLDVTTK